MNERLIVCLFMLSAALLTPAHAAEPAIREVVGEIVSARGNETLRLADSPTVQRIAVGQTLAPGDVIVTGPYGSVSILFRDDTQIRLHRNSLFKVGKVRGADGAAASEFTLSRGALWSRAKALARTVTAKVEHGRAVLHLNTPSATLGIRGTDWHVMVDSDGHTTATVLSGEVELANDFGTVSLQRGEIGSVARGQAPSKRSVVDLRERPLIVLVTGTEWLETLSVTGWSYAALTAATSGNSAALLPAEMAYDRGDFAALTAQIGTGTAPPGEPRLALLAGLLHLRGHDFAAAQAALAVAMRDQDPRRANLARLAAIGVLVEQQRFADADAALAALGAEAEQWPDTYLLRAWLASFAGDHAAAIDIASAADRRFPTDSRFASLLAHLYFLTDQRADMVQAYARALAQDAADPRAWFEQGLYFQFSEPDAARAIAAFRRCVELRPSFAVAWNQLGLVYYDIGDFHAATAALDTALQADPVNANVRANYGIVAAYLGRLSQAEQMLDAALALDPGEPYALLGKAYLDLLRGQPSAGVDKTLRAAVANPELPGIDWFLAAGTYQSGNYPRTVQALDVARRRDPDDPIPDLIGSVAAVDNFEAGEAIRLARTGFDKTLRAKSFQVDTLANAKGGSATLGQAYSNLGLDEWGGYYSLLAFDPYVSSGYFYLSQASQFDSERARLGANLQGLMLDPTAVSFPTRYFEPFRQERHDFTTGGSVGVQDGALTYAVDGIMQGLVRRPDPIAYYLSVQREYDDGDRADNAASHDTLLLQLGSSLLDQTHNLLFSLTAQHFNHEIPGTLSVGDPDDEQMDEFVFVDVGYQYRFNYHNRVMARIAGGYEKQRFSNDSPFGRGLGSRDYSLIRTFGLDATRALYAQGLYDITPQAIAQIGQPPTFPLVLVGALSPQVCVVLFGTPCAPSPDTLAQASDDDVTRADATTTRKFSFQFRHLLDIGVVEFTYGAEANRFSNENVLDVFAPRLFGFGSLIAVSALLPPCPNIGIVNAPGTCAFVWDDAVALRTVTPYRTHSFELYGQGRWKITPELWVEGGAFLRDVELAATEKRQVDPRIGLGWRVTPHHWLRVTAQSELVDPLRSQDTLAPVATLGMTLRDAYFAAGDTVPSTWFYQARWDAEWASQLFTFAQVDRQDIEDFALGFEPDSRFTIFGEQRDGRLDTATVGANLWFAERFGLSARYQHLWSENRSGGSERGRDLALIPEAQADLGLVWVHPLHVSAGVFGHFVGARAADPANRRELASYWLASAYVNWQPLEKHLSLTLSADNIFNESYERSAGFPGVGPSLVLSAEYRF